MFFRNYATLASCKCTGTHEKKMQTVGWSPSGESNHVEQIEIWIVSPNLYHIRSNPNPNGPCFQGPISLPAFETPWPEGSPSKDVHREANLLVEAMLEVSGHSPWAPSHPKAQALHFSMAWILKLNSGLVLRIWQWIHGKEAIPLDHWIKSELEFEMIYTGTRWSFEQWVGS